jgi:cell cycle checkpoint control protein RAD9A
MTQLTLRTLNTAQSAFVVFSLQSSFFYEYLVESGSTASVKIHLKNLVSIFRSITGVDRVWLQLACSDPDAQAYMRIQLQSQSGVKKKYDLALKEVTPMNAVYSRSGCPHRIVTDPQVMIGCLGNFPHNLPEVSS